jgi:hypothetical protein
MKNRLLYIIILLFLCIATLTGIVCMTMNKIEKPVTVTILTVAFALMFLIDLWQFIFRKKKSTQFLNNRNNSRNLSIKGKKKVHMQYSQEYIVAFSLCLAAVAMLLLTNMNLFFLILFLITAFLGSLLLILLVTGFFIRHYLVFEREGMRIGNNEGNYLVTWDNIQACGLSEVNSRLAICVVLYYPDNVMHSIKTTTAHRTALQKNIIQAIESNECAHACHLMLLPALYGLDADTMEKIMKKYTEDIKARDELA